MGQKGEMVVWLSVGHILKVPTLQSQPGYHHSQTK
jgi:hypothetical protein